MRFCATCGADVVLSRPEGDDRERFVCTRCATIHYVNPKIVVGSVCTLGDRLLLCRRAIEPRVGYWTIPAGWLETGETVEQGAAREAWEEACARIEIEGVLAVYSMPRIAQVQILFRARLVDAEVAPGPESQEVRLIGWDEIPWDELAFPTVGWALRRARELRGQDQWITGLNPEPI
ncbi:MAG TPA: NUDIX hydrolase [Geminicoccus sp.]|uniref:NUDIX hydrolase n=1 Tax=Geminicoccus sp. TaxID=2024832 RepID=UPI002CE7758A|nr:NUDIX hydrolase [Geminicoccus sp.]HWL69073.1 NUDIX hydrolase [Geminicoccus sp.]